MPVPSFIQIGDRYHPTLKYPGLEEIIEDDDGNRIEFDSAPRAVAFATKFLAAVTKVVERIDHHIMYGEGSGRPLGLLAGVEDWRAAKAGEAQRSRDTFALRKVQVVRKKRRGAR